MLEKVQSSIGDTMREEDCTGQYVVPISIVGSKNACMVKVAPCLIYCLQVTGRHDIYLSLSLSPRGEKKYGQTTWESIQQESTHDENREIKRVGNFIQVKVHVTPPSSIQPRSLLSAQHTHTCMLRPPPAQTSRKGENDVTSRSTSRLAGLQSAHVQNERELEGERTQGCGCSIKLLILLC